MERAVQSGVPIDWMVTMNAGHCGGLLPSQSPAASSCGNQKREEKGRCRRTPASRLRRTLSTRAGHESVLHRANQDLWVGAAGSHGRSVARYGGFEFFWNIVGSHHSYYNRKHHRQLAG